MTKAEIIQQAKNTALNSIMKIYHPLYKGLSNNLWDDSHQEQRDSRVKNIVTNLEKEIEQIKAKHSQPC